MLYKLQVIKLLIGQKTFTDNLKLNDSDILIVGTGNDLQIMVNVGDNTLITNTNFRTLLLNIW